MARLMTKRRTISRSTEFRLLSIAGHTIFNSRDIKKVEQFREKRAEQGVETRLVEATIIIRECD
jgi:hypothetical protein